MKKVAVVVDAYSTGRLLVEPLKRKGFTCLHVQSTNPIPSGYLRSFQRGSLRRKFVNECEWEDLVSALRPHHPTVVLCGTESGVELADYLSERLGCPRTERNYRPPGGTNLKCRKF